ncbi:MAG: type I-E CRISPR-associated protein Cse2/CasB [Solirubrobacteraceae bacterium]|nr:type I-E CRISPR-associated protein Cse2/CasB [Solirubrobacteraceae bacterium]
MSIPDTSQSVRAAVADALHDQLAHLDAAAQYHRSDALRTLAQLRRGVGRRFGDPDASPALMRLIGQHIDLGSASRLTDETSKTLDDALAVAALVARAPRPLVRRTKRGGASLGRDLRALTSVRRPENVEALMQTLLGSGREALPRHLRRTIALLGADRLGLDVAQLVRDLGAWQREDRAVQRRWAFHFWLPSGTGDPDASDTESIEPTTDDQEPA